MNRAWLLALFLLVGNSAAAQTEQAPSAEKPAAETPANHILTPPAPVAMPTIDLPPEAPPLTAPVEIDVVLTIDESGAVTAVEITRSGGDVLDGAVAAGAKKFTFKPATQDGVPIPVRIPFTQKFEPPPPPLVPAAPELDAFIEGIVATHGTRSPVSGATVAGLDSETGRESLVLSDANGVFKLPVRSGRWIDVRIAAAEHDKFVQKERLAPNQVLKVKYLIDRKSYGQYESFVRAETDRTEVSRTTLSGREITRIPGTFGDPFRVINVLPGVSSAMSLLPLPIVRGSSPGNTGILLDGIRLPLLFHLFAGPSVIHPEFIDRVDFYPGGFPVNYGGYTGGIVDGVTRAARPEESRVDLDVTLTQTGVLVREPIKSVGVTATVAGRIGYPGLLLGLLNPDVSLGYWDYQARFDGGTAQRHWSVFFYGAEDELKRRPAPGQDMQTVARFAFHRSDLRYERSGEGSRELYRVVLGYDDSLFGGDNQQVAGNGALGNGTWSVNPQFRFRRTPIPWFELNLGAESALRTVTTPPAGPNPVVSKNQTDAAQLFNQNGFFSASGVFAETVLRVSPRLRLIPGLRADLYDERHSSSASVSQWNLDPRFLARYRLSDSERGIWLKGVIGRYHQPPRLFVPIPGVDASSLNLGLLASTQYSVGAEARLGAAAEIDVNAYFNSMDPILFDLTVNPTAGDVQQAQPSYPAWQLPPANRSTPSDLADFFARRSGRSYGLEVLLRRRDAEHLFGWVSYTLSHSERRSAEGWIPFDFDRLHMLNFVAGLRLPRNWEFGTRVLLQTGTPLTTIFGQNVTRSDGQFRLDLRLDKRAVWNKWLLDFYVDIINATEAQEAGGLVGAAPIRYVIPTVGFRAVL